MLKKRLIFTLLHTSKGFALSRNFRLQYVGNMQWLQDNYNFQHISMAIDELVVLNVNRDEQNKEHFLQDLSLLNEQCFIPIAAGGFIQSLEDAYQILRHGADKLIINTALIKQPQLIHELVHEFGQQCIIGAADVIQPDINMPEKTLVLIQQTQESTSLTLPQWYSQVSRLGVGEIYINSVERDGTGQGLNLDLLQHIQDSHIPLIIAGGVGNSDHLFEGFQHSKVDAVACAHLFNFIGDGLIQARSNLIQQGIQIPSWDLDKLNHLHNAARRAS